MTQNQEIKPSLLVVDAYNILYKAFYGNQNYLNSKGTNIGAVYTAFNIIWSLGKFDNTVVVFDGGGGSNYRKDMLETYKENRKSMPDDLTAQIPIFKRALEALDIKYLTPVSAEADDMAGSIAVHYEQKGYEVTILSGDKDFRQIINDNICVYDSSSKTLYNKQTLLEKKNLIPEQIVDFLSLLGDASDNIKGVDGWGETTATKMLQEHGSIENIYQNYQNIKFRGKTGENFLTAYESGHIAKNQKLISLDLSLFNENLQCLENKSFEHFQNLSSNPDSETLDNFINEFEFFSWKKKKNLKP